ncbi:glycosyltransferase [Streptomyces sp. DSM 42041]|uniref:Glycosyltransferase n=1 Tax=Streptomyces hazeniae TaxID=3075538 RepID=A0ABU2P019_9ACTN|nr:glycosyltransferase [Streptomyces sp. DSM 42041]MDT0381228.1 glycosyltransferase [Streptomyces sp. DSM 42041]
MSVLTWTSWLSLAAWLWLLLAHGGFWRTDVRLPPPDPAGDGARAGADGEPWPPVAIVVPARDEAAVLPLTLPSLLAQRYPGPAEVVLVDDGSSDGTGEVARTLAASAPGALPLTVCSPGPPPPGWTGKLWAVRHGVAVARSRRAATYLLLTDADIAHPPDSLHALVRAARDGGLDLVSLMARLRVATGWERLVVPAFVYFFAQLYPFSRVNRPGGRTAAAAGGCMLLRADAADRAGLPGSVRGAVIDDVAVGRAVKRGGGRVWLGLAGEVASVRPYEGLAPLWAMVARSAYAQLRHSRSLLAVTVAGLLLVYVAPPATALAGHAVGWAAWALMTLSYLPAVRYHRVPWWVVLTLPAVAVLYLLMTVDSAVRHHRGAGAAWKGRTYAGT